MPIRAVRSPSNAALWRTFTERFLSELGDCTGPSGYPAYTWLTHRAQRDALFREAAGRGLPGWLAPPVAFLSDFPRLFDLRLKPLTLLRRRLAIGGLAEKHGREQDFETDVRRDRRGIEHALDRFIGELLPEGIKAGRLRRALGAIGEDDFARRRNAWVAAVYEDYLDYLTSEMHFDPRAIHGFVSSRIADGHLRKALGDATRLHIYGLTTLRTRRRLVAALAKQEEVDVLLYLPEEEEQGELDAVTADVEELPDEPGFNEPAVQPAPDDRRELEFVAHAIKRLVHDTGVKPYEIAVVARHGREDTRRAHEVLSWAGVPTTARVRSSFAEVPALKAILHLFRAAAHKWTYRPLRHVLESAYFDLDIDLRSIDHLARGRRIDDLGTWLAELSWLRHSVEEMEGTGGAARDGVFGDRVARDVGAFHEFFEKVHVLEDPKPLGRWITLTRKLIDPGWFGFRQRVCDPAGGRFEVVRLDQSALDIVDRMLLEWSDVDDGSEERIPVQGWLARLRRFLAANEIAVSTPMRMGVQVLEAHEAALFPFKHTFVIHANEGEFPARPPTAMLFSDDEREVLAVDKKLPITTRDNHLRRERTLWRAVVDGAGTTITYRTADANGVPLLPSLMVPPHDPSNAIPRTRFVAPEPFNRVTAATADLRTFAEAQSDPKFAVPLVTHVHAVRHAILGAVAEAGRGAGLRDLGGEVAPPPPGPWNGALRDPWVLDYLAKQFGPDRLWSASQLELYARCPFVYLVQRVLHLDELAEADEQTSALTFGSIAHTILERFYAKYRGPFPSELSWDGTRLLESVADETFSETENDRAQWLGLPALWAITKRELRDRVGEYIRYELPLFSDVQPHYRELSFGFDPDDAVTITGANVKNEEVSLSLRGKIDRVDVSAGEQDLYHVVDYKSGAKPSTGWYKDGSALQAPLYMQALALATGEQVATGLYRSIKQCNQGAKVKWGDRNFERALSIALSIPARIRDGVFEVLASKGAGWSPYWPGRHVTRVQPVMKKGCRFDE